MPSKVKNTRFPQPAGKGSGKRDPGHQAIRWQRRTGTNTAPVVLGGFRDVTFKPITGAYAYSHLKSIVDSLHILNNDEQDITTEKVYAGLYKSYDKYHTLLYGEPCGIDFLITEGDYGRAMERMIKHFALMADPNHFNIDQNKDKQFCFVIYAETPWDYYWHVFDIKKTVAKLKRKSPRLHDLFLAFIKALDPLGIDCWFEYAYGHILDGMEDWAEFDDGEDEREYRKILHRYNKGRPSKYQSLICASEPLTVDEIILKVNKLRSCPQIIELIKLGCDVLCDGKSLKQFSYDEAGDADGEEDYYETNVLRLENQIGIMWDLTDRFTGAVEEWLDVECQNGNATPKQFLIIDNSCTSLFMPDLWTGKLSAFMKRAADLIEEFTK